MLQRQLNMDGFPKTRCFANPLLMLGGTLYIVVCVLICFFMILGIDYGFITVSNNQNFEAKVIFTCLGACMIFSGFLCAKRWFTLYSFSKNRVKIITPFETTVIRECLEYKYKYVATSSKYGYCRYYLVYSTTKLSVSLLTNADMIPPSHDIIKIRCSRKHTNILQ